MPMEGVYTIMRLQFKGVQSRCFLWDNCWPMKWKLPGDTRKERSLSSEDSRLPAHRPRRGTRSSGNKFLFIADVVVVALVAFVETWRSFIARSEVSSRVFIQLFFDSKNAIDDDNADGCVLLKKHCLGKKVVAPWLGQRHGRDFWYRAEAFPLPPKKLDKLRPKTKDNSFRVNYSCWASEGQ